MFVIVLCVVAVLFMALCAAIFFRSSARSRDHHYQTSVVARQSFTSPIGSHESQFEQPSLEVRRSRDSRVIDWQAGRIIEQHDEISVVGPPDAVMYIAERAEQAARDSFSTTYALEPPDPTPENSWVLPPDQYRELPESSPQDYDYLDWQDNQDDPPSGW